MQVREVSEDLIMHFLFQSGVPLLFLLGFYISGPPHSLPYKLSEKLEAHEEVHVEITTLIALRDFRMSKPALRLWTLKFGESTYETKHPILLNRSQGIGLTYS